MSQDYTFVKVVICDNCQFCTDKELIDGHRRRGFCRKGHGWVPLGREKQCMYHKTKGDRHAKNW